MISIKDTYIHVYHHPGYPVRKIKIDVSIFSMSDLHYLAIINKTR